MQSLNELIAHSIECVYASLLIRKQEETVCFVGNNLFYHEYIYTIRMEHQIIIIMSVLVMVIKLNKHR